MDDFGTVMSWLIIVIILGCIYAIPSYVSRGKVRFWQVFWINILLGWTLVWWVVALVMAIDKGNIKIKTESDKDNHPITANSIFNFIKKRIRFFILWFVIISVIVIENVDEKDVFLSQEERIYRDLVHCQDEVRGKLEEQYPMNSNDSVYRKGNTFDRELHEENAYKNIELSKTAFEPCNDMMIEKYKISSWELKEIGNKALKEDWIWKLGL